MQRIRLQPVSNFILVSVKVIGTDGKNFRDIEVALDTGATTSSIPRYVASALGYNVSNPKRIESVVTGSGVEEVPIIEGKGLTAIGQTVENIEIICHDLPDSQTLIRWDEGRISKNRRFPRGYIAFWFPKLRPPWKPLIFF